MDWLRSAFKDRSETKSYDEMNGLVFNDIPVPEEIIMLILSYADTKTLLSCKLVCKEWNTLICSTHFWRLKLEHINKTTKKHLPWYVYYSYFASNLFDRNLIQNGNAEKDFKHWKIAANGGDAWKKEPVPAGADLLPENVPDFNGETSCFATSYITCAKFQKINLRKNRLMRRILDEFQPTIYMSEWYAGRFDCGCKYKLRARLYNKGELLYEKEESRTVIQWAGHDWSKVEIACDNYGKGVTDIEFYHEGVDTQFWAGHYGSKMAGGVVKILFDSLETRS